MNQLTIIGFVGKTCQRKDLPNGTPSIRFSVATKKSWKNSKGEWEERTQWHQVVCYGTNYLPVAERLVKGAHVLVQGELTTREYARKITVPTTRGETIEHEIQQLVVEVKADLIRTLDRNASENEHSDAVEPPAEE